MRESARKGGVHKLYIKKKKKGEHGWTWDGISPEVEGWVGHDSLVISDSGVRKGVRERNEWGKMSSSVCDDFKMHDTLHDTLVR